MVKSVEKKKSKKNVFLFAAKKKRTQFQVNEVLWNLLQRTNSVERVDRRERR